MPNDYNWPLYFEKTQNGKPRENLVRALDLFAKENFHELCMDIGSGAGNDISYLLDKGWKVIAFDPEEDSQRIIHERFPSHPNLNFTKASFKEISWEMVDLINCSYVLPFCEKDYFDTLLQNIITHVKPGSRFAGNFFGPRHGWNHLNLVSKEKALSYFSNFNIEYIHEVEEDKISALDEEIFFHNIDLVARKRS